jgi:hypothetical protein
LIIDHDAIFNRDAVLLEVASKQLKACNGKDKEEEHQNDQCVTQEWK